MELTTKTTNPSINPSSKELPYMILGASLLDQQQEEKQENNNT